jgi:sugar phosphate permease
MEMNNGIASTSANNATHYKVTLARPRGLNMRWVIVGIITLLTLTNYLDRGNLSVAAPLIMKDLHISNTMMGVILSAFVWPYAITSLPTGWAVDRFGAKMLMAFAAGAWSIIAVLTGFARSIQAFICCRIALGIAESPLFPSGIKATDAWFPDHEKALASSIYLSASQFGLAIAPPVSSLLIAAYGWPAMFIIMGTFGFVALLGWLIAYREPELHPWLAQRELNYIRSGQLHSRQDPFDPADHIADTNWFSILTYRTTWAMILGGFCLQYVLWFYIAWLPTYLQSAQGITVSRSGLVAAIPYISGGIGVVIGGKLSDLLIRRGLTPLVSRRVLLSVSAVLTGLAMFGTAFASSSTAAVAMLTAGMFTYSLSSANYWTLAAEAVTTRRMVASLAGIQNFGGFLGGGCAPILTGVAVDRMGGFVGALVLTGCLALLSALMYGLALKKKIPV